MSTTTLTPLTLRPHRHIIYNNIIRLWYMGKAQRTKKENVWCVGWGTRGVVPFVWVLIQGGTWFTPEFVDFMGGADSWPAHEGWQHIYSRKLLCLQGVVEGGRVFLFFSFFLLALNIDSDISPLWYFFFVFFWHDYQKKGFCMGFFLWRYQIIN